MTAKKLRLLFTYNADSICDVVSMKFHVDALHNFMLRTKFKYENKQRTITPILQKYETLSYGSFALYFSSLRFIYLWSFMLMPCILLKFCSGQKGMDRRIDWQTDIPTDGHLLGISFI